MAHDTDGALRSWNRRRLLQVVGAGTVAGVAGCPSAAEHEFVAEPAGLSTEGARSVGYWEPADRTTETEYRRTIGNQDVTATVESRLVTYGTDGPPARVADWSVPDPPTRSVVVLSTPTATVLGQSLNPVAATPLSELVGSESGRELLRTALGGEGVQLSRQPEAVATSEVEVLGEQTDLLTYAGVAVRGQSHRESFLVNLARASSEGTVVVFAFVQRRRVLVDDEDPPVPGDGEGEQLFPDHLRLALTLPPLVTFRPPLDIDWDHVARGSNGFSIGLKPLFAHGFNYIAVRELDSGILWHDTFNPARYDPAQVQADVATIADHDFNLVRVFVDHMAGDAGVIDSPGATTFSADYLANVADFLRRAGDAGLYVVLALPGIPRRASHPPTPSGPIGGRNRLYLARSWIDAKADYLRDFLSALFDSHGDLTPSLFAVELENETHVRTDQLPFSERTGTVTTADGETYDRTSDADLQRMVDSNVTLWANTCTRAVREVAPDTLVSASVFPYQSVGLDGPGNYRPGATPFDRIPAKPLALARTNVDYLDVHLYHGYPGTWEANLESIDFDALTDVLDDRGMPLLLGEFGAKEVNYRDRDHAASVQRDLWNFASHRGYHGFAYWPFQNNAQDIYGATEGPGDGTILETLADLGP